MGTSESSVCKDINKKTGLLCGCVEHKIRITAIPTPGAENVIADYESTKSYKDAEWMLNPSIYKNATENQKFKPELDCFTSRLNTQQPKYTTYKPDAFAYLIDAFLIDWRTYNCYLFLPFSFVGQTLQKNRMNKAKIVLVVPKWPTQLWYNSFLEMLYQGP